MATGRWNCVKCANVGDGWFFATLEISDASKRAKGVLSLRNLFWGFCNLAVWRIVINGAEAPWNVGRGRGEKERTRLN
ncbi:MAG: hypothetical protein ACTS4U_01235 [Candidatus Hodgkinia cicadicola]